LLDVKDGVELFFGHFEEDHLPSVKVEQDRDIHWVSAAGHLTCCGIHEVI